MLKIEIFVFSAARTCIENDRIFYLRPVIYAKIMTLSILSKDGGVLRVFVAMRVHVRALLAAGHGCSHACDATRTFYVRFYCRSSVQNRSCKILAEIALHRAQSRLSMPLTGV
jgi:hypothetical protein